MKKILIFGLSVMVVLSFISYCLLNKKEIQENFSEKINSYQEEEIDLDRFKNFSDPEGISTNYALMYHKTFNPQIFLKNDCDIIRKLLKKWKGKVNILDAGCGTGRYGLNLSNKYGMTCIDKSNNMLNVAKLNLAGSNTRIIKGDFLDEDIFNPGKFSHILATRDTLGWIKNLKKMFNNFNMWLRPGGIVYVHVLKNENPHPAPGDMALNYKSREGSTHSFSVFPKYTHDAFWGGKNLDGTHSYYQKYDLKNGKKHLSKINMWLHKLEDVISFAKKEGLELVSHHKSNSIDKLVFQKKKNYYIKKYTMNI